MLVHLEQECKNNKKRVTGVGTKKRVLSAPIVNVVSSFQPAGTRIRNLRSGETTLSGSRIPIRKDKLKQGPTLNCGRQLPSGKGPFPQHRDELPSR